MKKIYPLFNKDLHLNILIRYLENLKTYMYKYLDNYKGFKNLTIVFNILAGSLNPFVDINYDEKLESHDKLEEYLDKFFLGGYTLNRKDFIEQLE
jgi:hypothetical protein